MLDELRQDVRYALRLWTRKPSIVLVTLLTLALGIGANTAMFSVVNAVLLRPLPYAHGDRLAVVWGRTPANPRSLISWPEYLAFRQQTDVFDDLGVWLGQSVNLTGVAQPQRILGAFVSGSFFDVLELRPERGRFFDEAESAAGTAKQVVVISRRFWQQQFGSDPDALGATLTLNGNPLTVVGILAPPFDPATVPAGGWFVDYDAFIPVGLFPAPGGLANAGPLTLSVARLKSGVGVAAANAQLDVVAKRLQKADPKAQEGRTAEAIPAHENLAGDSRTPLLLLLGAVAIVLLIACVNVSNLLGARAIDRRREIALRSALGATRAAVVRQLVVEAAMLAGLAASLGLLAGRWSLQALQWLRPPGIPIPDRIPLDATVLGFTLVVGLFVAVLCSLAPAARTARADLTAVLQASGRRTTPRARLARDGLVVVEIALSIVLIALSGLLVRSMLALQRVDVGFDPANVFTLQLRLPPSKYPTPRSIARFFEQAIARIRAVPGVESAALVRRVPFSGNWGDTPFTVEGASGVTSPEPRAGQNIVTPGYFSTMRIPIASGRDFTDRDDLDAPPVVVVNETLARTFWPTADALGRRLKVPDFDAWLTVIGIVGDAKHRSSVEPAQPQLYLAHYQLPMIFTSLVARTAVPPLSLTTDVRRAVWSVDKEQPVWSVAALDTLVANSRGPMRFIASLLAIFAGIAILLAAVGVYGVMAYAVTERTHEIGIRMALGASSGRVRREVVGRGVVLTAIALAAGIPSAAAAGRLTRGLLFGVGTADLATLAASAALLGAISIAACYLPARRASRVDPAVALAEE